VLGGQRNAGESIGMEDSGTRGGAAQCQTHELDGKPQMHELEGLPKAHELEGTSRWRLGKVPSFILQN
jgi:hypothetical protein